jgi:hypothetical protein
MLGVLSFDSVRSERPGRTSWWAACVFSARRSPAPWSGSGWTCRRRASRFQRFLSSLSVKLSNVSAVNLDQDIQGALRSIVDFLGMDRAVLIELPGSSGTARSWTLDGPTDLARLPWLSLRLQNGDSVRVPRVAELPDEAAVDRSSCLALGIHLLAPPLRAGKIWSGIGVCTAPPRLRATSCWSSSTPREVVANALSVLMRSARWVGCSSSRTSDAFRLSQRRWRTIISP